MIGVIVADDQALVRAGFRVLIDSAEDLEVLAEAGNGAEAVELARDSPAGRGAHGHPDAGHGRTGSDPAGAGTRPEGVHVLMLTTFDVDEYVFAALKAGASGFLLKDTPPAELLQASGCRRRRGSAAPSITKHLIEEFVRRPEPGHLGAVQLDALTEREIEVLAHVAKGWSNSEIAERSTFHRPPSRRT